ncbi:uncharacterized protein ASPGLDRAFT_33930 [Aspergillus glaucus CBS 516.65]|uniref:Uncharacterized protein n=1 Tax=Aspergillus glaucus CBS 516.65 TaxID=1160497 RepID=A0A1L9VQ30_ASPGL|nr:hypothetical protein ASPGLDRAFT_33930 [Aspergillus glaucus CBS 516.65]OJJ86027.1 hypothetical protein ASPGLDRAFT_33930 [Aspergillus glaucus CBS 516.65]
MDYKSGYNTTGTGTNSQGNHYCNRDYGNGANSYHYSNTLPSFPVLASTNGSYYYSNPDGSKYYNNGQGSSVYTPPSEPAKK